MTFPDFAETGEVIGSGEAEREGVPVSRVLEPGSRGAKARRFEK